jgi:hypothetical protein
MRFEVLHLGEGLFYGVELGRVARQQPQLASLLLYEVPDPPGLVHRERLSIRIICPLLRRGGRTFLT